MDPLPSCPFLPPSVPGLDWRWLHAFRDAHRGQDFYFACLQYAQSLWERRLAARAILCLDRAMGAELYGHEPVLSLWPMPYRVLTWLLDSVPAGLFVGNPRIHFQHYADRLQGPRQAQRRARAWACWRLACACNPLWPGDPRHRIAEPTDDSIIANLSQNGLPGEELLWSTALHAILFSPHEGD